MWNYMQPVKIRFGAGSVSTLSDIIENELFHGKKGFVICGKTFVKNGIAKKIASYCKADFVFSDISQNPDVSEVDKCVQLIKESGAGYVVALGGGSILDCAKAAATICFTDEPACNFHGTGKPLPSEHLPLIAIPTTAGTGSEVTCVSVLTDRKTGKKAPIVSDNFYPDYAIIDPELTYTLPANVTANTGMDVLSHAIEGYWSKGHQPVCDACALHSAGLVFENLEQLYKDPDNKNAREKMCEASVIAGLAFSLPKTTSSHACSFPLTNIYGIPHGEACALTLDWFTRLNAKYDDGRLGIFSKRLGFADACEMADRISEMKANMNMLTDLKNFDLSDSRIDELVRISRHPNLYNNPAEITDAMLYDMYNSMR